MSEIRVMANNSNLIKLDPLAINEALILDVNLHALLVSGRERSVSSESMPIQYVVMHMGPFQNCF